MWKRIVSIGLAGVLLLDILVENLRDIKYNKCIVTSYYLPIEWLSYKRFSTIILFFLGCLTSVFFAELQR